jgi:hypothetical protein
MCGIVLALAVASASPHAVWHAALGLFVAEGLGMAVSEFLSDSDTGLRGAALMGAATGGPILAVGAPWTVLGHSAALVVSILIALALAGVIALLRGGGTKNWAQTLGILGGVSVVAALSGAL